MYAERHTIEVTTDAEGDAEAFSPVLTGRVHSIAYVKNDFEDGVDFTITAEATGESLWTDTSVDASAVVHPVATAILGADGTASQLSEAPIVLANDRVKIVVGDGGAAKTGTFIITVGG